MSPWSLVNIAIFFILWQWHNTAKDRPIHWISTNDRNGNYTYAHISSDREKPTSLSENCLVNQSIFSQFLKSKIDSSLVFIIGKGWQWNISCHHFHWWNRQAHLDGKEVVTNLECCTFHLFGPCYVLRVLNCIFKDQKTFFGVSQNVCCKASIYMLITLQIVNKIIRVVIIKPF